MEEQYLQDLDNAREVVLDIRQKVRAPGEPRHSIPATSSGGGSAGRAAAGAIRLGNAVGAAFSNRRVLHPPEQRIVLTAGVFLLGIAVLFYFFPHVAAYPLGVVLAWIALALIYRGYKLQRDKANPDAAEPQQGPNSQKS